MPPRAMKSTYGVMLTARGPFEVKVSPVKPDNDDAVASGIGRLTLDKIFYGDLEASSRGQMLAVRTEVAGSAGYVAMERVTGVLRDRRGSFALQHSGTMAREVPQMSVTVVPDSGTGELVGLAGKMTIEIVDGKHSYEFEYTLP